MCQPKSAIREQRKAIPEAPQECRPGENLLVVEPEALLRWSLTTYLAKWFQVFPADARPAADRVLKNHSIHALVMSDDLADLDADELEVAVRSQFSLARVIRTVSRPSRATGGNQATIRIEKPFELARLARLLGIEDTPR